MESEGRKFHGQAEQARERGEFVKALELTDQATVAYLKAGDLLGFGEVHASRSITKRHLADELENEFSQFWLVSAKNDTRTAVETAEKSGNKEALALPYFNLAKIQEVLGEFQDAVKNYQKAVENQTNNSSPFHNRAAVLKDMKIHLETCAYKAGDKFALERAEAALKELEVVPVISDEEFVARGKKLEYNEEVSYNKNVWASGGHMRIAEMLREDNPEKAKEHLQKAKEIIDSDPRLELRRKQWGKLAKSFE